MRLAALLLLAVVVTSAAPPVRIVSTAPSFTETLFALGAGDRVVAVSTYCHFPPEVAKLPRIGSYLQPNIETIARLKPDLVLVHAEQQQYLKQLAGLGIRTLALRNTNLDDVFRSLREIGIAIGEPKRGEELEAVIRGQLAAIEKRNAGKARRTLLFVVGRTPGRLDGMVAVGKGSYLNDLIRVAGGRNVLSDSPVTYPRISLESVMRLNPDVIVDMGDMAETTGVSKEHMKSVEDLWRAQNGVRASATGRVFAVAADIFVVPGPRVAEAASQFYQMLFGEGRRP